VWAVWIRWTRAGRQRSAHADVRTPAGLVHPEMLTEFWSQSGNGYEALAAVEEHCPP
jgi:hypothetical protein